MAKYKHTYYNVTVNVTKSYTVTVYASSAREALDFVNGKSSARIESDGTLNEVQTEAIDATEEGTLQDSTS